MNHRSDLRRHQPHRRADQPSRARHLDPPPLGHRKPRLHWVRDVTFDEDRSQIRAGIGPRATVSLRNLAVSILRINGAINIAQAIRHHAWDPLRPVTLLLTS